MNSASELAELRERLRELLVGFAEELVRGRWIPRQGPPDHSQLESKRDQPLLRTVVQVSLQASALGVGRLDDPCS